SVVFSFDKNSVKVLQYKGTLLKLRTAITGVIFWKITERYLPFVQLAVVACHTNQVYICQPTSSRIPFTNRNEPQTAQHDFIDGHAAPSRRIGADYDVPHHPKNRPRRYLP